MMEYPPIHIHKEEHRRAQHVVHLGEQEEDRARGCPEQDGSDQLPSPDSGPSDQGRIQRRAHRTFSVHLQLDGKDLQMDFVAQPFGEDTSAVTPRSSRTMGKTIRSTRSAGPSPARDQLEGAKARELEHGHDERLALRAPVGASL